MESARSVAMSSRPRSSADRFQSIPAFDIRSQTPSRSAMVIEAMVASDDRMPWMPSILICRFAEESWFSTKSMKKPRSSSGVSCARTGNAQQQREEGCDEADQNACPIPT
jgi:hypothetical protein